MGVANGTILRMVLLQAMVVAGIGYAIGIGLCAAFFEFTSRVSINLRGFELPWQVAIRNGRRRPYHHRHRKSRQRP